MKKKIYKEEKNENKMSYEINSFVKMVGKKYHKYQRTIFDKLHQPIDTFDVYLSDEAHENIQTISYAYTPGEMVFIKTLTAQEYLMEFFQDKIKHSELLILSKDKMDKLIKDIKELPASEADIKINLF